MPVAPKGFEPALRLLERIRAVVPAGVDAALDAVGTNEAIDTSVALVARRDRIVTLAAAPRGFDMGFKILGRAPGADLGTEVLTQPVLS